MNRFVFEADKQWKTKTLRVPQTNKDIDIESDSVSINTIKSTDYHLTYPIFNYIFLINLLNYTIFLCCSFFPNFIYLFILDFHSFGLCY